MDDSVIIREFERLARRLGIDIRYTYGGPSGLCTVKGTRVLFIDRNTDIKSRIQLFTHEFNTLDLHGIFVVPLIRKLLRMEDEDFEG